MFVRYSWLSALDENHVGSDLQAGQLRLSLWRKSRSTKQFRPDTRWSRLSLLNQVDPYCRRQSGCFCDRRDRRLRLCQSSKMGHPIFRPLFCHELEEDFNSYEYVAFVAYHKDYRNWVVHELIRNLKGGLPGDSMEESTSEPRQRIRLCVRDRDFLGGVLIQENISQSIEKSRKTILVISKNLAQSSWCEYELQMARMQSLIKGREIIVTVLLEPADVEQFSKTLGRLIRKNTYIEWLGDPRCKRWVLDAAEKSCRQSKRDSKCN